MDYLLYLLFWSEEISTCRLPALIQVVGHFESVKLGDSDKISFSCRENTGLQQLVQKVPYVYLCVYG